MCLTILVFTNGQFLLQSFSSVWVEEADLITLSLFCATLGAHEAIHERDRRGHLSQPST